MSFSRYLKEQLIMEGLWDYAQQEFDSGDTSQKQNPSAITFLIKRLANHLKEGNINADIGGGKYDLGSKLLSAVGIENLIYDPYNQRQDHNSMVVKRIQDHQAPTVTISNVLNVIKEPEVRNHVLKQARNAVSEDGVVVISIYLGPEGNEKGRMTKDKEGRKCWQNNQPTKFYIPEVQAVFPTVKQSGNIIVAYPR